MINIILLIGNNSEDKKIFIDKLNKEIKFSYTKLEAIFETFLELYPKEFSKDNKENFSKFLISFLNNLKEKNEVSVLDLNILSIKNAELLMENNKNVLVIYLEKVENANKSICLDVRNEESMKTVLENIKNNIIR